ncbi:MAG: YfiR family protein [Bacteroidetes bacterium]|nr:MAG: YfiR family protein [Bacteroidota bacterium]
MHDYLKHKIKNQRFKAFVLMRNILAIMCLLLLVSAGMVRDYRQIDYDVNAKKQAIYIYNFSKYINWPEKYKDDKFIIGVLGNSHVEKELQNLAATRKVYNQTLVIKHLDSPSEIEDFEIVYVGRDKADDIPEVIKKTKKYNTLVITDKPGSVYEGAGISFVVKENKIKFELSKKNLEGRSLDVSSQLVNMAIIAE